MILRTLRSLTSLGLIALMSNFLGALSETGPLPAPPSQSGKLQKHDRSRLSEIRAQGGIEVALLIASAPGKNEAMSSEIRSAGGAIRYRADDVSYLRSVVPVTAVETIARSENVEAINLIGFPDYQSGASAELDMQTGDRESLVPAPDRNTPAENPYLPTRDIGAPQFVKAHPTFDGRGVTIAVIEDIPDLLSPELQTALTINGEAVRKIAEIHNAFDPNDYDPFRIKLEDQVNASSSGTFTYKEETYKAPADGVYWIGIFDATTRPVPDVPFPATYFSYFDKINLSANPKSRSRFFPVLWNGLTDTVWIDTNQNNSFADEKAMMDYNVRQDVNAFGKDDPATPNRDTMGFVVLTNPRDRTVTIGMGSNSHTSGIASGAAGKSFFGGKMNGCAPEAQLVFMRAQLIKNYSPIEAMILAARNPKVDLLAMSWGIVMRQNDGHAVLDVVFDRLIEKYQNPIFIGAHNGGPAMNTVYNSTSKVITVGGYISGETWRANYAVSPGRAEYVSNMASRGPREDGAFKPDIIAPIDSVMVGHGLFPSFTAGQAFKLPSGYQQTLGTSFSGPMAAGGGALLISAAKQAKVAYDAERIKWAIRATARFLPDFGAHDQGAGLMNVGAAWEALRRAPETIEIHSRASVKTALGRYLKDPDHGPGIYEREGWTAGQTGRREISFIRTTGPAKELTCALEWIGNDGTFSSPRAIRLPLNKAVNLSVTINPRTIGAHSALLNLVDSKTSYPVYQVMNTVVAAESFTAANDFTNRHQGEAEFLKWQSYFFYVPPGVAAFKVDMKVSSGNVKLNFFDPTGSSYFTANPRIPGQGLVSYQNGGAWSRAFANPYPGVWEVVIINQNTGADGVHLQRQPAATFDLSAQVFGVDVQAGSAPSNSREVESRMTIDFTNRFAAFKGGIAETPLGSAYSDRPVLTANGHPQIYDINVADGASTLSVTIGQPSDPSADLDLYLYDCSGEKCIIMAHSLASNSEETVTVNNPKAGKWKAVIDPFSVPSGQATCEYLDVFTHPLFGSLSSSTVSATHELGSRWSEEIVTRVGAPMKGPRKIVGMLNVLSPEVNSVSYRISEPTIIKPVAIGILVRTLKVEPSGRSVR